MKTEIIAKECADCEDRVPPDMVNRFSILDMELSDRCNLRCDFCYVSQSRVSKLNGPSLDRSMKIISWFLEQASVFPADKQRTINIYGGEPLFEFESLQQVVNETRRLFPKENIRWHVITNATLLTKSVWEWMQKNRITFQVSVDGCPEVQDRQRVFPDGSGSSRIVEKNLRFILADRPETSIRSTITPLSACYLLKSVEYFVNDLGARKVQQVLASGPWWTKEDLEIYEEQLFEVVEFWMDCMRKGVYVHLHQMDLGCKGLRVQNWNKRQGCGAGRSMICVDTNLNMWPCHRYALGSPDSIHCLGNLAAGGVTNRYMQDAILTCDTRRAMATEECKHCDAQETCIGACAWEFQQTGPNGVCSQFPTGKNEWTCDIIRIHHRAWAYAHRTMLVEGNGTYRKRFLGQGVRNERGRNQAS